MDTMNNYVEIERITVPSGVTLDDYVTTNASSYTYRIKRECLICGCIGNTVNNWPICPECLHHLRCLRFEHERNEARPPVWQEHGSEEITLEEFLR